MTAKWRIFLTNINGKQPSEGQRSRHGGLTNGYVRHNSWWHDKSVHQNDRHGRFTFYTMVSAKARLEIIEARILGMENAVAISERPRAAKVGHKKSRLGCQRCKTRRVKCDEKKPTCTNCERHGVECIYIEPRAPLIHEPQSSEEKTAHRRPSRPKLRHTPSPGNDLFPVVYNEKREPEVPETKQRRMMELRLMQHTLLRINIATRADVSPDWINVWQNIMPKLALEFDNVLYAVFTLSATHMLQNSGHEDAVYRARQNYFVLALREQRQAIDNMNTHTIDAVCITAILILLAAFAMLQERTLTEYTPPMDWMQMGRGVNAVMWRTSTAVPQYTSSIHQLVLDSIPVLGTDIDVSNPLPHPFSDILSFDDRTPDYWDQNITDVYERTLHVISSAQDAINNDEPQYIVGRRIQAFPIVIPERFTDFVKDRQPRALVVLAHYFGVMAQVKTDVWFTEAHSLTSERIAYREIRAIADFLPSDWHTLMEWPLSMIARQ